MTMNENRLLLDAEDTYQSQKSKMVTALLSEPYKQWSLVLTIRYNMRWISKHSKLMKCANVRPSTLYQRLDRLFEDLLVRIENHYPEASFVAVGVILSGTPTYDKIKEAIKCLET